MTYVDRTLTCVDCGVEFIHSAADQEYYVQKGFTSEPKRCTSCRASRRATRDAGYDVREIGGPRGYERGDDRAIARVLRRHLLVLRQPGPGPVQAAHGPPGLLLRLLPDGPPGHRLEAERLAGAIPFASAAPPDRDAGAPWTCQHPSRPTTAVSSSMPRTTEPRGDWSATSADSGSGHAS